jgi:HAD superfamily hydrolase (TIGR01509 family)
MAKLSAAIFDIDGTLVDSNDLHAEAWRRVFQQFGRDIPFDQVRAQIGKGGDQLMPVFFSKEELDRIGKVMEKTRGQLFKSEFMPKVRPFPGVRDLFERLKADGLKITLASSAKKDELEHYVELLDVKELIETGTSADDAEKSKPHPDIFEAALEKLGGLNGREALVVGDTPYDAEAAAKAGIKTVGVLCGGFPEKDLRGAGAIAIFQDPADLLRRYEESPFRQKG